MFLPEQVIPFLQHDDPVVRRQALMYFHNSYDFGSLTAEHYWAVIDRFGENKDILGFAADLMGRRETDASFQRLLRALTGTSPKDFEHHYQRAARNMEMGMLAGHREELLACPQLRPGVREHLELRLKLLDEPPAVAWDRLMEHGRMLENEDSGDLDLSPSEALAEAAARGGREICEKAMLTLADESAAEDWREIYAVNVLGLARYEPAVDALVAKLAIDADILREETNRALARIATPRVIERIVEFYPGKPWHVRLYARNSPTHIKRPESEEALLKFLSVESALEADPSYEDEGPPLVTEVLIDLTELISLAGLEASRRRIETEPDDPENLDLCESMIGAAIMHGVTLPEEDEWRKQLKARDDSIDNETLEEMLARISERLRRTSIRDSVDDQFGAGDFADAPEPSGILPDYRTDPIVPIRNTAPKIGRNDPCSCGSGKKYKKCCGK